MRVSITDVKKEFRPIKLELELETEHELMALHNAVNNSVVKNTILWNFHMVLQELIIDSGLQGHILKTKG